MWKVLVVGMVAVVVCHGGDKMNQFMDKFLQQLEHDWRMQGSDKISLDRYRVKFNYMMWSCVLDVQSAWLENFSEVQRWGQVFPHTERDNSTTLSLIFTMNHVILRLEEAELYAAGRDLLQKGLTSTIDQCVISFKVNTVRKGKECEVKMQEGEVVNMSGFDVGMIDYIETPLTLMKRLVALKAIRLSVVYLHNNLNQVLYKHIQRSVQTTDFCKLTSFKT